MQVDSKLPLPVNAIYSAYIGSAHLCGYIYLDFLSTNIYDLRYSQYLFEIDVCY
jgi:hypothetical protein